MTPPLFWRVTFFPDGRVNRVRPIKGPGHSRWVVVQAADEEQAKRKAYSLYCAHKKKLAKQRHHAAGECACGRKQDRKHPSGAPMLTCSVCAERQHSYNENAKAHPGRTFGEAMARRDESARVAANLVRQRDRKGEIRLETLVEVRQQWIEARNVALFGQWLQSQIDALTKNGVAA